MPQSFFLNRWASTGLDVEFYRLKILDKQITTLAPLMIAQNKNATEDLWDKFKARIET